MDLMIGGFYFTPFDPPGRVKVLRIHKAEGERDIAEVQFEEDHPHGYAKGSTGNYFADELRPANKRLIVVNARSIPDYTACIYIGRKCSHYEGSPLGNPFKIKHESERAEALQAYREWLNVQMASDTPARREIERIASLFSIPTVKGDLALICWCAPKACHGDVVKEFVERAMKEGEGYEAQRALGSE